LQLEAAGNRNRLVSLAAGVPPIVAAWHRNTPGYPLFGSWMPGLLSYEDANGDGVIAPTEVVVSDTAIFHGPTIPTRTLAANSGLSLFNNKLRLGAQVDYRGGFVALNASYMFSCAFVSNCRALHDPTASVEDQAKAVAGSRAFGAYVENAEHIRLREMSVNYTAPMSAARLLGARSLVISLIGRNLLLKRFGFQAWDPENVTYSADGNPLNYQQQAQPLIGILRFNIGF
jgi:hypothetical protein